MSKAKVTPIAAMRQAAPRTIPLSEITITWPPLRDFNGESEKPITLSGVRLGVFLAWKARTMSGDDPCYRRGVRFDLRGLAALLRGIEAAEGEDLVCVLPLLATIADDLAARLAVADDAESDFERATVTIGAPTTEAK